MRRETIISRRVVIVVFAVSNIAFAESIIGTAKGKVYHNHPEKCSSAKRIQSDNVTRFESRADAERAGRRQCRSCAKIDKDAAAKSDTDSRTSSPPSSDARNAVNPRTPVRLATDSTATLQSGLRLPQFVHAKRIIDGGTIELDTGDKAGLLGIVVPKRGQPAARDACRFIKEQTHDRLLKLSLPEAPGGMMVRDALGRWRVSINPQGGRDLAGELLFQGYAWLNRNRMTSRTEEYARLEEAAWSAGRGIWRQLEGDDGQRIVTTGRGATEYHDKKCAHVAHLTDPMQLAINEARARRLVPCDDYRAKGTERSSQD